MTVMLQRQDLTLSDCRMIIWTRKWKHYLQCSNCSRFVLDNNSKASYKYMNSKQTLEANENQRIASPTIDKESNHPIKGTLDQITSKFNADTVQLIIQHILQHILNCIRLKRFGPEKCLVYLKLLWIGENGMIFVKQILAIISHYFSVNP